jgi:Domain of unknown function (DUF4173)
MSRRQRTAVGLVVAALVLGAGGDVLFHGRPLGVNAGLFAVGFVVALAVLLRVGAVPLHQGRRYMVAPLLLFAALLAWHDSPLLVATNLLAIAGAVTLGALRRTEQPVASAEVGDYVAGAAAAGAATFAGALELMERDLPWERLNAGMRGGRAAAIGRGLAIGFPFLLLFGGLFVAADAVFRSLLESALPDWRHVWSHVLLALGLAWLSAGLLRDLLASREDERLVAAPVLSHRERRELGPTEVAAALVVVDLLFLAFVLVQLRYLFGGRGLVEARVHLTYAQYARHGFFELLAVSLLVFPLLLAADYLTRGAGRRARLVRVLSVALVALVLVVMASALQRMRLYQREYGLTELRIYATGVIVWLGCVFVLLAATVLRGRPRAFASGAVVAGFVATLALNVLNPDALIARTNLDRPKIDVAYVSRLSADAVPTLLQRLPSLAPEVRRPIAAALLRRSTRSDGWLAWNASRRRADVLLRVHRDELQSLAR